MAYHLSLTDDLLEASFHDPEQRGMILQQCANYLKLLARTHFDPRIQARVSVSDIVQDTLLEAFRDFDQFRGRNVASLLAWLRQVLTHNLAEAQDGHLGAARRDVRRERSLDQVVASVEGSGLRLESLLADGGFSPSAEVARHEQLLALADALSELPDDYRETIVGRHVQGLAFREIAARMGRSEGAVRMVWFRAIDRLRTTLGQKGVL